MSFREAMPPRTTHQGLCPWTPLGDFRSADENVCAPHLQILAKSEKIPPPPSKNVPEMNTWT